MKRSQIATVFLGASLALLLLLQSSGLVIALDPDSAAAELVALTNLNRTTNGLAALLMDRELNPVALSRSEDMLQRNYFSHQIPPDNHTVIDIFKSLGMSFRSAGENIEWNTATEFSTVQYASNDFFNSPSHRANILNPPYNKIGAAVAEGSGRRMYTVLFMQRPQAGPAVQAPAPTAPAPSPPRVEPELTRTPTETPVQMSPTPLAPPATAGVSTPSPVQPAVVSPAPPGSRSLTQTAPARLTLLEAIISKLVRLFLNL